MKIHVSVLIVLLMSTLLLGFFIGQTFTPFNMAFRKAQELSRRNKASKETALSLLTSQKELIEASVMYSKLENERHIIALSLANSLIQNEMWQEALQYLLIARDIKPNDYLVLYNFATVYYNLSGSALTNSQKDEYSRLAYENVRAAIDLNPESIDANYLMGALFYDRRMYSEALNYFKIILNKVPDEPRALFAAARLYYNTGDLESAKKIYLKLEGILPKNSIELDRVEKNLLIIQNSMGH